MKRRTFLPTSYIPYFLLFSAVLFFAFIIWYSAATDYQYYIADSLVFLLFTFILFFFFRPLQLDTFTFFSLLFAFFLHDLGAFRFYASPPLPLEWDLVTHLFGIFAVTLWISRIVFFLHRSPSYFSFFLVLLAGLGFGVVIEFVEYTGFALTGFGEGFFGRGFGDFDPRIVSSDYIDTI
ncbi:MAG: hypothetical protein AABW64_04595, partial [Nanoarchaeota archaeon]